MKVVDTLSDDDKRDLIEEIQRSMGLAPTSPSPSDWSATNAFSDEEEPDLELSDDEPEPEEVVGAKYPYPIEIDPLATLVMDSLVKCVCEETLIPTEIEYGGHKIPVFKNQKGQLHMSVTTSPKGNSIVTVGRNFKLDKDGEVTSKIGRKLCGQYLMEQGLTILE